VRAIGITSPEYTTLLKASNSSLPNSTYTMLNTSQWRAIYDRPFVSGYGDLYLAVDGIVFNSSTTTTSLSVTPSYFLPWEAKRADAHRSLSVSNILVSAPNPNWVPYAAGVPTLGSENATFNSTYEEGAETTPALLHTLYGFAKKSDAQSRIQISFQFMMVVIAFNIFKLFIMVVVLVTDRRKYIVTLGDAAASFLERPEPLTSRCCLMKADQIILEAQRQASSYSQLPNNEQVIKSNSQSGWLPQTKERYYSDVRIVKGTS
jgi:hypothetical protein